MHHLQMLCHVRSLWSSYCIYRDGGVITTMNKYLALVLLLACLMLPISAWADVFTFAYNNSINSINANGLITASATATPGIWSITDVTRQRNGDALKFFSSASG